MDGLARPLTTTESASTGALAELRCPTHTARGRCNKLLIKAHLPQGERVDLEMVCPRCHTLTTFRLIPRSA
jgi:phage FluMu protein Com